MRTCTILPRWTPSRRVCVARSFIPKTRTKEVSFLKTQFRAGTVMLMIIAVAMFATTHSLLTTTSNEVAALGRAGLQRKLIVSTAFHARSLALDNMNPATVRTMLAHVATFKQVFRDVYVCGLSVRMHQLHIRM